MSGLLVILLVMVWAVWYQPSVGEAQNLPVKLSEKLDKLWAIAQESLRENKYLRAEKALLTILRVDEKNATAYNRLGILYAKQRAYKDAIECFEIAQSLEPSASSLHNVGLIYYETQDYVKAALAFEQALDMEAGHAARHIAYAKVQEKLGNTKKMLAALEKAAELEPTPHTLNTLAQAYDSAKQPELAAKLRERAAAMLTPDKPATTPHRSQHPAHPQQARQPRQQSRKVIM